MEGQKDERGFVLCIKLFKVLGGENEKSIH